MNQLSRSTGLKIAAVILWTVAVLGIVIVGIPFLTGNRPECRFFFLGLCFQFCR